MCKNKKKYTVDFREVTAYAEMHSVIKKSLELPDYYSSNWDSLWDCLTDMLGEPIYIEILGIEVIEKKFGDAAEMLILVLTDFKHYNNNEYYGNIQIEIVREETRIIIE